MSHARIYGTPTLLLVVSAGFPLMKEVEEAVLTLEPLVMEELPPDTVMTKLLVLELELEDLTVAVELPTELELRAVVGGGSCCPWQRTYCRGVAFSVGHHDTEGSRTLCIPFDC